MPRNQPQGFNTLSLIKRSKRAKSCACAVVFQPCQSRQESHCSWPEPLFRGAGQKERGSGDENGAIAVVSHAQKGRALGTRLLRHPSSVIRKREELYEIGLRIMDRICPRCGGSFQEILYYSHMPCRAESGQ